MESISQTKKLFYYGVIFLSSAVVPGIWQFYRDEKKKAFILIITAAIAPYLAIIFVHFQNASLFLLFFYIVEFVVYLYAVVDGIRNLRSYFPQINRKKTVLFSLVTVVIFFGLKFPLLDSELTGVKFSKQIEGRMAPTVYDQEKFVTLKRDDIQTGDLIVFKNDENYYMKRCVKQTKDGCFIANDNKEAKEVYDLPIPLENIFGKPFLIYSSGDIERIGKRLQ